ncbi:TAP42-like protein [Thamnocephalis sphaerospora]|uniref:TAP42-like protein n=1 Tax=Thamnocephalis sphaerospora TaxID=78915 RepID=A0A4P9XGR3_9FUNG|nr:TAP42-like protein [Thamnocephalis sphaerospora]|eukprot:RKP04788.1 TAP42-like protein [Thamnocephalis sphaerospora]
MKGTLRSTLTTQDDATDRVLLDAAKRREEKIARYKREKAVQAQIEALQQQLERAQADGDVDADEVDRSLVLALLEQFTQRAAEHLQAIVQEQEMLAMMRQHRDRQAAASSSDGAHVDMRAPPLRATADGPLLSTQGKPMRPFVITSKREQLRQEVFRPGWRLPTMSIDEYLEQERARGNIIEGGGEASGKPAASEDEDDEAAADAATYKARAWDDFTDENPRGWGNRMNKG